MPRDRREINRQFMAVDAAYKAGDMAGLRAALGEPPDFPNRRQPHDLGLDWPLEYAIYWSPFPFIAALLDLGADPNYDDAAGFPSLIATLSTDRPDRHAILELLIARGADLGQRGHNDWTPLHYAVAQRDLKAIDLLVAHGADSAARTRIDHCSTPLEDAEAAGFAEAVAVLRRSAKV
jgi:ankyrin repeat protein